MNYSPAIPLILLSVIVATAFLVTWTFLAAEIISAPWKYGKKQRICFWVGTVILLLVGVFMTGFLVPQGDL